MRPPFRPIALMCIAAAAFSGLQAWLAREDALDTRIRLSGALFGLVLGPVLWASIRYAIQGDEVVIRRLFRSRRISLRGLRTLCVFEEVEKGGHSLSMRLVDVDGRSVTTVLSFLSGRDRHRFLRAIADAAPDAELEMTTPLRLRLLGPA